MSAKKPITYEVDKNDCYNCTSHARKKKGGHCFMQIDGKKVLIHRYIYEQNYGPIPEGMIVRHKCDNPICLNPKHLELGTQGDNVRDRDSRNRTAKGERNGRAKISVDDVRYIREHPELSSYALGKMFHIDSKSVRDIQNYVNWKHVS